MYTDNSKVLIIKELKAIRFELFIKVDKSLKHEINFIINTMNF